MEIFSFLFVCFLGILAGIFTGMLPGVHINMVSMIVFVNAAFLIEIFDLNLLVIFIIVMGVVHSFVDFIPSVLFGVPSADTALSVLPGHRLVLEGRGYEAIFLSSLGSLFGTFFSFLIAPIVFFGLESSYEFVKEYIPFILMFTLGSLILLEKGWNKKFWAIIIVLFSAGYGSLILNTHLVDNPLLVLFSGLFGVSSIVYSLIDESSSIPKQKFDFKFGLGKGFLKSICVGGLCSTVCSISPGVGNAQAATIASLFFKKITSEIFIVVLSSINTIGFILSFLTFYLIERARNGSVYVISLLVESIGFEDLLVYFGVILGISIIGFFLTCFLGKKIIKIVSKINFNIVNICILIFLFLVVGLIEGIIGILICIGAAFLGLLCVTLNVRRVHLMGILLVPVIFSLI